MKVTIEFEAHQGDAIAEVLKITKQHLADLTAVVTDDAKTRCDVLDQLLGKTGTDPDVIATEKSHYQNMAYDFVSAIDAVDGLFETLIDQMENLPDGE